MASPSQVSFNQLPLSLSAERTRDFSSFVPGPNQETLRLLATVLEGQLSPAVGNLVFLRGARATGKTHLLEACCAVRSSSAAYIPLRLPQLVPSILDGLEQVSLICIDDVDAIAGHARWESGLMQLYNQVRARADGKGCIIFAANRDPRTLELKLPDLRSRLTSALVLILRELGDTERGLALVGHARARGLHMSDEVAQFLLRRVGRDMHSLVATLEELDRCALAAQRRLSVPFVSQCLRGGLSGT